MGLLDQARSRREVIRGALRGTAYAAPVVLSAVVPRAVSAASLATADLMLAKSADTAAPALGTTVTFTLVVNNRGPAPATGVVVADPLPAGLTFVSSSTLQGSYAATTGFWTIGTLAAGARATLTLVATAVTVGAKVNTATVRADQGDPDLTNNTASVTVTPGAASTADLAVTKAVRNPTPLPRNTATFRTSVTNNGPAVATGVTVSDPLPAGTTLNTAVANQGGYSAATGVWTVGTLAAGATATLDLTLNLTSGAPVTNSATIARSDQADPRADNNSQSATYTPPGIVTLNPGAFIGSTPPHNTAAGFSNVGTTTATNTVALITVGAGYTIQNVLVPPAGTTTATQLDPQTLRLTSPTVTPAALGSIAFFEAPGPAGTLPITVTVVNVDQFDTGPGTFTLNQPVT